MKSIEIDNKTFDNIRARKICFSKEHHRIPIPPIIVPYVLSEPARQTKPGEHNIHTDPSDERPDLDSNENGRKRNERKRTEMSTGSAAGKKNFQLFKLTPQDKRDRGHWHVESREQKQAIT